MKVSYKWLKELVNIEEKPELLAEDLSMVGLAVDNIEHLGYDSILVLDLTADRGDCLSHVGVGREIAAIYGEELKIPGYGKIEDKSNDLDISIEIDAKDLCYRYTGLVMDNVKVGPSPIWLKERLESLGVRSINNIVDITNYLLLETGQPLHAFDYNKLNGHKIIVRRAKDDEKIVTLDSVERKLNENILVIADESEPVAIAGIMGGEDSEVSESTDKILIECAYFNPLNIRKSSRYLGLTTEASYRFERGVDIGRFIHIVRRCAWLVQEICGGRVAGEIVDVYPHKRDKKIVKLPLKKVKWLLGADIPFKFIKNTLLKLGFEIVSSNDNEIEVKVPYHRHDIFRDVDLIGEISRIYGYNRLPSTIPGNQSIPVYRSLAKEKEEIRKFFRGFGFREILTTNFVDEKSNEDYSFFFKGEGVKLQNPLDEDEPFLRKNLVSLMLKTLKLNENNYNENVKLFELANVHFKTGKEYVEKSLLSFGCFGNIFGENWIYKESPVNYFYLKGIIEKFLDYFHLKGIIFEKSDVPFLQKGSSAFLKKKNKIIGYFGRLNFTVEKDLKFKHPIFIGEFFVEELFRNYVETFKYEEFSRFPKIDRDISFVIDKKIGYGRIESLIKGMKIEELEGVKLLDVYEGKGIPEGKVSLTLRVIFQKKERTLTDEEADKLRDRIVSLLVKKFKIDFR